ncbi:MAG: GHKL domain-containing protein [Mycoplasmataceae bacterium]|nr:GHKL domain-containing protein [Mycoplasmataceae bacterium]
MLKLIETLIVGLITIVSIVYMWHKLLNKSLNLKSKKIYFIIILFTLVALINYFNSNVFLRITLVTILMMFFIKILFNTNLQVSIITPIYSQMLVMVSELIFGIVISLIFKYDSQKIIETQFAQIFSSFFIALLNFSIVNLPFVIKFYKFIIKVTEKINRKHLITLSFFIIIVANILAGTLYYKVNYIFLIMFNTLLTLSCMGIVIYSYKTQNNYNKVYEKYNTTLKSLKEYENILDKYRISSHENKNELLTIRNMINFNDNKVIKYIDTIVENKQKDNSKVMSKISKIPSGGLRGLMYSKILVMEENLIQYNLDISKEISTVDLICIDDHLLLDICKIVGVYLDNAIDAVKEIDKKIININMYLKNKKLIISISNNYKGVIELNKLEEKGYTSKSGNNRGYGLSLTKEIIDNNKKLQNEKSISKEMFCQNLMIEI